MKNLLKKIAQLTLAGTLILGQSANLALAEDAAKEFDGETVKVGVVGDNGAEVWGYVADKALEEEGITIEVTLLTDYNQPNEALANGSLDINSFQHVAFLENWNEANDEDLVNIGFTLVTPMGLYSDKITSVDEIEEGASIAIPNDPTNGGRALLALEIAGLIEVDDEVGVLPTVNDVTDNPLNIEFVELDAAQVAQSLVDVTAAVINTGHAEDAGLSVKDDAIFVDTDTPEQLSDTYRNVIAARSEDAESPLLQKIVELYQTEDVAEVIIESSNGGSIPAWEGYQADNNDDGETEESSEDDAA
ncbi:MetQ/NlpA family ABC transporter substrate-binding protein [Aerococcaceae bacterium WGS1372]